MSSLCRLVFQPIKCYDLSMQKPILAIITHSIRTDNHLPLKYFKDFDVRHFYLEAPYGDLKEQDLANTIKWDSFKDLEKKLIDLNPDLIQGAETYASKIALRICLLTMKVAKKLNKPYFFPTLENRPTKERFNPVTGLIVKNILKKYAQNASLIYYLNEGAKTNLEEVGADPEKLKKALYGIWGIDTYLFKPIIHSPLRDKKYILFVGRWVEEKGLVYLLAAWNSIKARNPDVDLVFIGSGAMDKDISGSQIQKLGQMKNTDLPPYFSHALFTVYPSVTFKRWEEQVGTVNLQSLACGTPVLTTTSGAIPEFVTNEVGVLVPEKDAGALAEAMENLIKNSDFRQNLAKNARPYILEKFDAEKSVAKIEQELLEILKVQTKSGLKEKNG